MANVSITPPRRSVLDRLEAWLADWAKILKAVKAQAELRHKLRDADDHLLRDVGLTWTGRRYERDLENEDGRR